MAYVANTIVFTPNPYATRFNAVSDQILNAKVDNDTKRKDLANLDIAHELLRDFQGDMHSLYEHLGGEPEPKRSDLCYLVDSLLAGQLL